MRKSINHFLSLTILAIVLVMSGCSAKALKKSNTKDISISQNQLQNSSVDSDVIKEKQLDYYKLKRGEKYEKR